MIFVFGPYAAGKRDYVMREFGYGLEDMTQSISDRCPVLFEAQRLALLDLPMEEIVQKLIKKEVVIATETGCGVVPISKQERDAREAAGRLCVMLAQRAKRVIRVWYGIAEVLK